LNKNNNNVVCACSINSFKNSLDKFWVNEDVVYNYEAGNKRFTATNTKFKNLKNLNNLKNH